MLSQQLDYANEATVSCAHHRRSAALFKRMHSVGQSHHAQLLTQQIYRTRSSRSMLAPCSIKYCTTSMLPASAASINTVRPSCATIDCQSSSNLWVSWYTSRTSYLIARIYWSAVMDQLDNRIPVLGFCRSHQLLAHNEAVQETTFNTAHALLPHRSWIMMPVCSQLLPCCVLFLVRVACQFTPTAGNRNNSKAKHC